MAAKSSIKTVAERLSLSPGTVSIVLNGRGDEMRIAKKTQERIFEAAREQGYRPNIYARRLRQKDTDKRTTVIGVLWPSLYSSELLVRFFDGIQGAILEDGMDVEVVYKPYHYNEIHKLAHVFSNNLFNGVIVVGASDGDVEYLRSQDFFMPVVFFNRQNDKYSSVCMDDYATGQRVAELFYARGHRRVAFLESNLLMRHHAMRKFGFLDACEKLGLTLGPENIIKGGQTEEEWARIVGGLWSSPDRPQALFISLGNFVPAVYRALEREGIRVPEDLELMGYGDSPICSYLRPGLSVIDLPVQEIVKKCIRIVVESTTGALRHPVTLYEEMHFVIRESCGGFPQRK